MHEPDDIVFWPGVVGIREYTSLCVLEDNN